MARYLYLVLLIASFLMSMRAHALPSSAGRLTPSPAPVVTAKKTNKCCVCVYPNAGERDSDTLHELCEACLPYKYPDCDTRVSFEAKNLREGIKNAHCTGPINIMNIQHGPDPSQVVNIVEVCQSAYPGCAIKMNDLSCSTYENEAAAEAAIKSIRESLPDGAIVDICGSGSLNKYGGCEFYRVTKRYVVAPAFLDKKLGLCPRFGEACDYSQDGNKSFRCVDTLGREMTIPCCPLTDSELGYWGDSHGCRGKGCDAKSCPTFQTCREGTWNKQECSRDGACIKFSMSCGQLNKVCGYGKTGEECIARATPSPRPS